MICTITGSNCADSASVASSSAKPASTRGTTASPAPSVPAAASAASTATSPTTARPADGSEATFRPFRYVLSMEPSAAEIGSREKSTDFTSKPSRCGVNCGIERAYGNKRRKLFQPSRQQAKDARSWLVRVIARRGGPWVLEWLLKKMGQDTRILRGIDVIFTRG